MRRISTSFALALSLLSTTPASANHWMQTADPQVLQVLNTLANSFAQLCQTGQQQFCFAYEELNTHGQRMLAADYECKINGTQEACWLYRQNYVGLSQVWQSYQYGISQAQAQASAQSPMAGMNHAQRQQFLQNNFNNIMAQGRANSALLDERHRVWMDSQ